MDCFLVPDKYAPYNEDETIATNYRFFKTIYEELIAYSKAHPDEGLCALDHWDEHGNFHGYISDYSGVDYHYNPWFTGTWINY